MVIVNSYFKTKNIVKWEMILKTLVAILLRFGKCPEVKYIKCL